MHLWLRLGIIQVNLASALALHNRSIKRTKSQDISQPRTMSMQELTEEDIKLRYITPSIMNKGWAVQDITMETKVKLTDGKINLRGNLMSRGKAKYADYVLYYNRATPIAIIEAKDAHHTVAFGMQQAKEYAMMMDVPFAFSSNGLGFQEYDFLTGKERSLPMDSFPTKEELYARSLQKAMAERDFQMKKRKSSTSPTAQDKTFSRLVIISVML